MRTAMSSPDQGLINFLVGKTVTRCTVDFAFSLHFWQPDAQMEIRISGQFTMVRPVQKLEIDPEDVKTVGEALGLFNKIVTGASVNK